jgi:hypothetical protein
VLQEEIQWIQDHRPAFVCSKQGHASGIIGFTKAGGYSGMALICFGVGSQRLLDLAYAWNGILGIWTGMTLYDARQLELYV